MTIDLLKDQNIPFSMCSTHGYTEDVKKEGGYYRCRLCKNEFSKYNYFKNRDKYIQYGKKYYLDNKDKIAEKAKIRRQNRSPELKRKYRRRDYNSAYERLSDSYIKTLISNNKSFNIKRNEITQELIEVVRNQQLLKRKIKKIKAKNVEV